MKSEPHPKSPEERVDGKTGLDRLAAAMRKVLAAPAKSKGGSRSPTKRKRRNRKA